MDVLIQFQLTLPLVWYKFLMTRFISLPLKLETHKCSKLKQSQCEALTWKCLKSVTLGELIPLLWKDFAALNSDLTACNTLFYNAKTGYEFIKCSMLYVFKHPKGEREIILLFNWDITFRIKYFTSDMFVVNKYQEEKGMSKIITMNSYHFVHTQIHNLPLLGQISIYF